MDPEDNNNIQQYQGNIKWTSVAKSTNGLKSTKEEVITKKTLEAVV